MRYHGPMGGSMMESFVLTRSTRRPASRRLLRLHDLRTLSLLTSGAEAAGRSWPRADDRATVDGQAQSMASHRWPLKHGGWYINSENPRACP